MSSVATRREALPNAVLLVLITAILASGAGLSIFSGAREDRDGSWAEAVEVIRDRAFRAHFAFEDWRRDPGSVDPSVDIAARLDEAARVCPVVRDGGTVGDLTVAPFPPSMDLLVLCRDLDEFATLTTTRVVGATAATVDPAADAAVEAAFRSVLVDLQRLDQTVNAIDVDSQSLIQRLGWYLTAGLAAMLGGIVAVGRLQRRKVADLGRRNEAVLGAAAEGIYGLDARGWGVFANPAAAALLGRDEADLLGVSVHDVLHRAPDGTQDHPAPDCPIVSELAHGAEGQVRADEFHRADGTTFPAEYSAAAVAENEALTGGVLVFRDVTERRVVEEMKDQFISVVSHELRTPLTSIHGSLGLLAGGALGEMPAPAQRMLDIATTNTDRLVRLINDILDIERMRSGSIRMEREVVDAADIVEGAVASIGGMAVEAGVEVTVTTEPVLVWADRDRLTQVVVNLVSNAIKFSPEGAPVAVSLSDDQGTLALAVQDRGRGIPEDQLGTVFGRFQQVDASDSRDRGGTGLGLAISEGIVVQHDGRIWAERRPGGGTSMRVTMPAVRRQEPADLDGTGPVVMVVDDDPSVLEVVCSILRRHGYRTVPAASGQEAIDAAIAARPDALVLDLLMPRTNGWQVLGALRDHPATADVPAVILSVLAESHATLAPEAYDAWIAKPFDDEDLIAALTRAIAPLPERVRALVIEDDVDLATVLVATFARHGIDARHSTTAKEAREVVPIVAPDLIVLDLRLPDGDGVQLLHDLRADGQLRGVPVVVYTGYDIAPEERDQLDRDGAIVFTKTRVSPEEFEHRMLELIGALVPSNGGPDQQGRG